MLENNIDEDSRCHIKNKDYIYYPYNLGVFLIYLLYFLLSSNHYLVVRYVVIKRILEISFKGLSNYNDSTNYRFES